MTNLEKWQFYQKDLECDKRVITWNYIYTITACLARRVSAGLGENFLIYPNLYLVFVGDPGVSKSMPANQTRKMLESLIEHVLDPVTEKAYPKKLVPLSPVSCSFEGLLVNMAENKTVFENPETKLKSSSHFMAFLLDEELSTLFRKNTHDLADFFIAGYNCGDYLRVTKHQGIDRLARVCITLLGNCVPEWLKEATDEKILDKGFASRTIFVWCPRPTKRIGFISTSQEQKQAWNEIAIYLKKVCKVYGTMKMAPEVVEFVDWWAKTQQDKFLDAAPKSLKDYWARRKVHMVKIAIAAHYMERLDNELTMEDIQLADKYLAEVEKDMHLVFQQSSINPVANLADAIYRSLNGKAKSDTAIQIEFFALAQNGAGDIAEAVKFLVQSGKIKTNGKGQYIQVMNEQKPVDLVKQTEELMKSL